MAFDPTLDCGSLRQVVQLLQNQGVGQDASGEPAQSWQPVLVNGVQLNLWAEIEPSESLLASNKELVGVQVTAQATHLVSVRYSPLVTASLRFQYIAGTIPGVVGGATVTRYFEIDSVTDLKERHIKQVCACREVKLQ